MSFQPVVTLTKVPRDNSSFTLTDATPTDNISGWGSPNAPTGPASITSLFSQIQPYGGTPTNNTGVTGGVSSAMVFSSTIQDGVNNYIVFYGLIANLVQYSVSADGLTITSTDPNFPNVISGVKAISIDGLSFPILVLSIQGNSITLATAITPLLIGVTFYIYWITSVQALTINNGESLIVNGISLIPIEANPNDNALSILDNILLKLSAEIAFNCGNISKAHEAAQLLSGNKPLVTNTCTTCQ